MMGHFSLMPNDNSIHSLLEPPSPAYTAITIRRAFVVWLHSGQQNDFRQVCNYFHRLEALEATLTVEQRATSRIHEFNLHTNYPPTSNFLIEYFPRLYQQNRNNKVNIKEVQAVALEDCVFNLEGYHDMKIRRGATTKDIIIASQMIRFYCKSHSKSLRVLLAEFQDFAKKTKTTNSVDNITMYIKKKYLKDELVTWINMPKSFSFLDSDDDKDSGVDNKDLEETGGPTLTINLTMNANKNANQIKILINESRRKELFSMIPNCKDVNAKLTEKQKEKPANGFYDFVHKM